MYRDFVFALDCLLLLKELYYTLTPYETNPKPYWYKITMLIMLGWDVPGSSVHADLIPGRGTEIPLAMCSMAPKKILLKKAMLRNRKSIYLGREGAVDSSPWCLRPRLGRLEAWSRNHLEGSFFT